MREATPPASLLTYLEVQAMTDKPFSINDFLDQKREERRRRQESCKHENIFLEGAGIHAQCWDCGKREVSRKQKGCEMQ